MVGESEKKNSARNDWLEQLRTARNATTVCHTQQRRGRTLSAALAQVEEVVVVLETPSTGSRCRGKAMMMEERAPEHHRRHPQSSSLVMTLAPTQPTTWTLACLIHNQWFRNLYHAEAIEFSLLEATTQHGHGPVQPKGSTTACLARKAQ